MKKNIIKTIPLSLIAVLLISTSLNARPEEGRREEFRRGPELADSGGFRGHSQQGMHERKMDLGHHLLMMTDRLELTDEQEIEILKLSQAFGKKLDANKASTQAAQQTLREMRKTKVFDEAIYRSAMETIQPAKVEGVVIRENYRQAIEAVLTDAQKTKLEAIKAKMEKRMQGKKQPTGKKGRGSERESHA